MPLCPNRSDCFKDSKHMLLLLFFLKKKKKIVEAYVFYLSICFEFIASVFLDGRTAPRTAAMDTFR